jgi:hypothetical protein
MAKSIEAEILEVYDAAGQKRNEDDQTYWARLVQISVQGTDEQWKQLDAPAQEWINAGVTAKKRGTDYVPFPDAPPPEVEKEPEEDRFRVREVKAKAPAPAPDPPAAAAEEAALIRQRRRTPRTAKVAPTPVPTAAAETTSTTAAPKPRRARGTGNGRSKKPGVYAHTQEYVVKHPNASTQDIMAALTKKGIIPKQNTVQSVRGHTRDTIKVMQRVHETDFGLKV